MSFEDRLKESMADMLRQVYFKDVASVESYSDRTVYSGGCNTCAFEYAVVDIAYKNSLGEIKVFTYDGDFGELIRSLA